MSLLSDGRLAYEGVSFLFGDGTPYRLTGFKRGVAEVRHSDRDRPRADGRTSGRAFKSGPTHEFGLVVLGEGSTRAEKEASARERLGVFARAWSADSLRDTPGAVAELRIGERSCFGWPREADFDDGNLWDGSVEAALTFAAADDLWYADKTTLEFGFTPEFTGGLPVPAAVPFVLGGGAGNKSRILTVGGDFPAWPVFEIRGPITDPWIEIPGVGRLNFKGALAYDQTLRVDCRPPRGVWRDGSPWPGALQTSGSRLSDMKLPPGSYSIIFGGYDPTGTSTLRTEIASAFSSF